MAMIGLEGNLVLGSAVEAAIEARDEERRRIARELHDVVGQAMTVVRMNLAAARKRNGGVTSRHLIDEGIAAVDRAVMDVRRLAGDLRPEPVSSGDLIDAIRTYLEVQERKLGYTATLLTDGIDGRLGLAVELTCYRIVVEALINVARHARARHVEVGLTVAGGRLEVRVRDDGVGFDTATVTMNGGWWSLGLLGMAERVALVGGSLEIESQPGVGTLVTARLPLSDRLARQMR